MDSILSVSDNIEFKGKLGYLEPYFATRDLQPAVIPHVTPWEIKNNPKDIPQGWIIWSCKLYSNDSGHKNEISADGTVITEHIPEEKTDYYQKPDPKAERFKATRVVFMQAKGEGWKFRGVFIPDHEKSNSKVHVFKRIATKIRIINPPNATLELLDYNGETSIAKPKTINDPLPPKAVLKDGERLTITCGRCLEKYIFADRCPECGQLLDVAAINKAEFFDEWYRSNQTNKLDNVGIQLAIVNMKLKEKYDVSFPNPEKYPSQVRTSVKYKQTVIADVWMKEKYYRVCIPKKYLEYISDYDKLDLSGRRAIYHTQTIDGPVDTEFVLSQAETNDFLEFLKNKLTD